MSTHDSSNVVQNQQAVVKIGLLQQTLAAERSAHQHTTDRLKRILYLRRTDAVRHKYALQRTRKAFDKRLLAMDYVTDVARKRAVQLRVQLRVQFEARKEKAARLRTQLAVDAAQAARDAHNVIESEKRKKEQKAREDFQQYIQQRIKNFLCV